MEPREIAIAMARGRIALGVSALAAPGVACRAMFGREGSRPGMRAFARMLGGRDVIALDRGAPVRGWLEACALADGVDLVSCLIARDAMTPTSFRSIAALAGGAALAGIWLSRQLDPPPPADPGHPEAIATGHPAERVEAA
jgi:hypothetical protein